MHAAPFPHLHALCWLPGGRGGGGEVKGSSTATAWRRLSGVLREGLRLHPRAAPQIHLLTLLPVDHRRLGHPPLLFLWALLQVNGGGTHPIYQILKRQQPVSVPSSGPRPPGEPGRIEWK